MVSSIGLESSEPYRSKSEHWTDPAGVLTARDSVGKPPSVTQEYVWIPKGVQKWMRCASKRASPQKLVAFKSPVSIYSYLEINMAPQGIRIAIDRGGTFTDAWAQVPGRPNDLVLKVLSQCPENYEDAPTECIRQILEIATDSTIPRGIPLDLTLIEFIRMGTTVATNALLERKGENVALIITKGFRDLLRIGNQARPHIFDLSVHRLSKLYETVVEIDELVTMEGFAEDPEPKLIDIESDPNLKIGLTGEIVRILRIPDLEIVRHDLQKLWDQGYRNVAIAMLHSYTYQEHELAISKLARTMGFKVAASSELQTMAKIVPRSQSAVADAYLSPITDDYIENFRKGFKGNFEDEHANKLFLNQSDGGLATYTKFTGLRGVLSGPAGGVIGLSQTCYDPKDATPVLGFDSKLHSFTLPQSTRHFNAAASFDRL